jgi:hypothetical protein
MQVPGGVARWGMRTWLDVDAVGEQWSAGATHGWRSTGYAMFFFFTVDGVASKSREGAIGGMRLSHRELIGPLLLF